MANDAGIFKRHNVDVALQNIPATTGMAALLSGQVDIAELGGSQAVSAAVGGADLVVVATLVSKSAFILEVAPGIKSKEDLIGKKIGVTRFGSSQDTASRTALRQLGLNPEKDVSFVQLDTAAAIAAALFNGALQGALQSPPNSLKSEAQGFHPMFSFAEAKLPSAEVSAIAQRAWVAQHSAAMQRFIDSIVEATVLEHKDKPRAMMVLGKYLKLDDQQAVSATYDHFMKIEPVLPYPSADQFADILTDLSSQNQAAKNFDVQKLLDASFVKDADNRGLGR